MDGHLERLMYENKSFVGYDQKDVKKEILQIQSNYSERKKQIVQRLELAKKENQALKERYSQFQTTHLDNQITEEIKSKFINVFLEHTQAIHHLKIDLEKEEKLYYREIRLRKQKRELAKQHIQEATDYLRSLQDQYSYLRKSWED